MVGNLDNRHSDFKKLTQPVNYGLIDSFLFPHQKNNFNCGLFKELNRFREIVDAGESGLHQFPYTVNANKIRAYQIVFFLLSVTFFLVVGYTYFAHFNWVYHLFFVGSVSFKYSFLAFCSLLAIGSCFMGFYLTPEKEIAEHFLRRARKKIKKIYRRRVTLSHCVNYSSPMGALSIRESNTAVYEDLQEKITSIREETLMTLKRVRLSKVLDHDQKEALYNQTILELQYQLECLVFAYQKNQLVSIS